MLSNTRDIEIKTAYAIIEKAKRFFSENYALTIDTAEPVHAKEIDYDGIYHAALHLINGRAFVNEMVVAHHRGYVTPETNGLEKILTKAEKIDPQKGLPPGFTIHNGVLENICANYMDSDRTGCLHTHTTPLISPTFEEISAVNDARSFGSIVRGYFFSIEDLVFVNDNGVLFIPVDYHRLEKARTIEDINREKERGKKQANRFEVKGFYVKRSRSFGGYTALWDVIDTIAEEGYTVTVSPLLLS